MSQKRFILDL